MRPKGTWRGVGCSATVAAERSILRETVAAESCILIVVYAA